jgi:hypothetical protein
MSTRDCAANGRVNALIIVQIRDLIATFAQPLVQFWDSLQQLTKNVAPMMQFWFGSSNMVPLSVAQLLKLSSSIVLAG